MSKISGVYKITNTITGDFYIGSSKNIKSRLADHKSPSTWAQHPNSKLYNDMIQYGLNNFKFEIIEETTNLKEREQYWIAKLNPSYNSIRAKRTRNERIAQTKKWQKSHYEKYITYTRAYNNKLCLYNGETLTLNALSTRLRRQGISSPTLEAKKYLVQ